MRCFTTFSLVLAYLTVTSWIFMFLALRKWLILLAIHYLWDLSGYRIPFNHISINAISKRSVRHTGFSIKFGHAAAAATKSTNRFDWRCLLIGRQLIGKMGKASTCCTVWLVSTPADKHVRNAKKEKRENNSCQREGNRLVHESRNVFALCFARGECWTHKTRRSPETICH